MGIDSTFDSGRLTVYLSGELDHHNARGACMGIDELLDEYLPRECVLNLSSLGFMDSSGIAVIVRVSRRLAALGGRLYVAEPSKQTMKVLDAAGIDRLAGVALTK